MFNKFLSTIILSISLLTSVGSAQQSIEGKSVDPNEQESEQADDKITLKNFEGTWNVESIEFGGQKSPPQSGAPEVLKVSEGILNTLSDGNPLETFSKLKMTINEAEPMQLDLIRGREGEQGTLPCIFKFDEERVIIAMPLVPAMDGPDMETARPDNFDSSNGPFLVLTAVKAKEEDK